MGPKHLILNGFMATGKSTVGAIVAEKLDRPFVDLDEEIERREGQGIGQIFEAGGEPHFRRLEQGTLRDVLAGEPSVIAVGGGALQDAANRDLAEASGLIITLTCSPEESARRMETEGEELRPVGMRVLREGGVEAIRRLMTERSATYDPYPSISTNSRPAEQVADEVAVLFSTLGRGDRGAAYRIRFPDGQDTTILLGPMEPADLERDQSSQIVLLTDKTVDDLLLGNTSDRSFVATYCLHMSLKIVIPPGEASKNLESAQSIYQQLQNAGIERGAHLVAMGGGVVCDLAGFVASTYLRGLRLTLIPTTLLAQVDAAIGGKTGVDFRGAKNSIGTFYPAGQVLVVPEFLPALPTSRLREGLAEIVKIAFIRDQGLLDQIENLESVESILEREGILRRAIRNKVEVVLSDAYETNGQRALLNFGHTIGHAIETVSSYQIPHGECVAMGMVAETNIAVAAELIDVCLLDRLRALLQRLGLPTELGEFDPDELLAALVYDKKRRGGQTRLSLPTAVGSAELRTISEHEIHQGLKTMSAALSIQT